MSEQDQIRAEFVRLVAVAAEADKIDVGRFTYRPRPPSLDLQPDGTWYLHTRDITHTRATGTDALALIREAISGEIKRVAERLDLINAARVEATDALARMQRLAEGGGS